MEAKLYKIFFPADAAHQHIGETAWEIWIPETEMFVNDKGGVNRSQEPRVKKGAITIEISEEFVAAVNKYFIAESEFEKQNEKMWESVKNNKHYKAKLETIEALIDTAFMSGNDSWTTSWVSK